MSLLMDTSRDRCSMKRKFVLMKVSRSLSS